MAAPRSPTRIQLRNSQAILDAALEVFSQQGFRGATLDQIAEVAGLSKPNLLYYFPSKEAIHVTLLSGLMERWLAPLHQIDPQGEPVAEILAYVRRKLEMSRLYPRESRLFANEILQGAPRILDQLDTTLKGLVDEKAALIRGWSAEGRLAPLDPHHLIFAIWATTQHYADFDIQVHRVLGLEGEIPFDQAEAFLMQLFGSALRPGSAQDRPR
ncbi:TetR family transcriptional regulator [Thioclava sp. BHET1]|nr:TetR family transcriptional regulator [Thioclava sp. BHET1]